MSSNNSIRNIVIMGHGGTGKTAFAESALYNAGMIDRMGKTSEGNTTMDFDAEEIRRGISINTSLAQFSWQNMAFNLIDTPGDFDFIGEQMLGLSVADAALILLSGKDKVSVGTEKAVRNAMSYEKPFGFFINRLDEPNASFTETFDALREYYGSRVVPVMVPFTSGDVLSGYVDVISKKAYSFSGKKGEVTPCEIPAELTDTISGYYDELMEQIAESDEALMEKYFEGEAFDENEISYGISKAFSGNSLSPVFGGSTLQNFGVAQFLQFAAKYFPDADTSTAKAIDSNEQTVEIKTADESGSLLALVFKTIVDPFVGKISLFRVYRGTFEDGITAYNINKDKEERINGLFKLCGKKQQPVKKIVAGDIGAVAKLTSVATLDTIGTREDLLRIQTHSLPVACLTLAIEPVNRGEEDKIMQGLHKLEDEDIVFRITNNAETHQFLISGLGETELDVLCAKLKGQFGVEAKLTEPRIAYRETITKEVKVQGKHKKQTGGHGQYGDVWIVFKPGEKEELTFDEEVFGGAVPKNYFPAVEKGLQEAVKEGVLAGYPVVNLHATLVDGSYHDVDSNEMSFKMAAHLAYKNGMPLAKPVLLEPINKLNVYIPDDYLGDIMGDLNKRRGKIMGITPFKIPGFQVVSAEAPAGEIAKYATDLKSMTQGRGWFTLAFERYEQVPAMFAEKIIAEAKAVKTSEK